VKKKSAFVAALAVGAAILASPAAGYAQQAPGHPGTVQLNADTAVLHGLAGVYQGDGTDTALGGCVAPGTDGTTSPRSARFTSPVLSFANYNYGPLIGVPANVSADAKLNPGTKPGQYPLTLTCEGKTYQTTFTVKAGTAEQVLKVPSGAARAGGGGTAP
jgi:hypothetical protein